jgi:Fe-S cluster biosynthesis and repair protein YggX
VTSNNIKQVRDAFARLSKGKVTEYQKEQTILIETDYLNIDKEKIGFYAYMHSKSKKIFFTDAGRTMKQIKKAGQDVQESVIQALITSYGLLLLPDNTIIEQQDLPLHDRISNILQVQIGVDSMIRTWAAYANKVQSKGKL